MVTRRREAEAVVTSAIVGAAAAKEAMVTSPAIPNPTTIAANVSQIAGHIPVVVGAAVAVGISVGIIGALLAPLLRRDNQNKPAPA
jgi:hypothetical protein